MIMADRDASESFGSFLKEHRLKYGVTLEQLSDGLCSASGLARIEAGARTVGLEEEAALFFQGEKTVDETAEVIQNRVRLLLQENL